jgi:multidrug efflux pump subunit AcrA (membrane-fusion protein)
MLINHRETDNKTLISKYGNISKIKKVKKLSMKTFLIASKIFFLCLICVTLTSCLFSRNEEGLKAPELRGVPEIRFYTIDVEKKEIKKEIKDSVKIEPARETPVFTKYGGWLKECYVKRNDFVEEGDLLVEFDSDSIEIKLQQQELALEKAKLKGDQYLKQIQREIELAIIDINKTEEKLSEKENLRNNLLSENSSFDVRDLDKEIENLKVQIIKQNITLEGIQQKYEIAKANLEIDIVNYEMQVEEIKKQLESTRLYAPKSGMVFTLQDIDEGEYVSAYRTILTIVSIEDVQLKYTGINASKFEVGMKVTFTLDKDELPGEVISAPYYYSKDAPDSVKEAVIMKIEGLTVEKLLSLKSDIRVTLVLDQKEDAIVIPKNLLNNYLGFKYVYVLENGMKKQRFVETGIDNNLDVEIIKGLNEGDELIST